MKKITLLLFMLAMSLGNAQYTKMGITGDGVGGWPDSAGYPTTEDINQMTSADGVNWTLSNLVVGNGSFKFRGDYSWANNWGSPALVAGTSPLTGTAISNNSQNFVLPTGLYNVTFNSTTLAYTFAVSGTFPTISLFGTAVSNDPLNPDVDLNLGSIDGITYKANNVHLYPGTVKWRQDGSSTISWGPENSSDLSGTAVLDGSNSVIIVVEADYNVTFNTQTLAYTFTFPTIAIVGNATTAGWPAGTPGEIDPLVLDSNDGVNYFLTSIALTAGTDIAFKFRADNSWNVQWGASTTPEFPSGIGTQSGGDINPDVAGTYSLAFNRETGVYFFTVLSIAEFNQSAIKAYPNPTRNNWTISSNGETIQNIRVRDFSGKVIMEITPNATEATINASGLSTGMYFANVATASGSKIIKVVKQ